MILRVNKMLGFLRKDDEEEDSAYVEWDNGTKERIPKSHIIQDVNFSETRHTRCKVKLEDVYDKETVDGTWEVFDDKTEDRLERCFD